MKAYRELCCQWRRRRRYILIYVATNDGREVLLPLREDFIHELNHRARLLRLALPQGLLDING